MLKRLLITGAAGGLGRAMRPRMRKFAHSVRISDITEIADFDAQEEQMTCDLGDAGAVMKLVEGCDGIIHLGGISVEDKFSKILNANIVGLFNLYEAARAHGHPRILFASSNHTVGYYRQYEHIDATAPMRPDSLYGVSKCFGEALARMHFEKFGQETAIVRIGSCFEKPKNHRMLATWMSFDDFEGLIDRVFNAPLLGCPIIFGVSDNDRALWDNSQAAFLGWRPKDNAEIFRAEIDAAMPVPSRNEPASLYHGGHFVDEPIIPEQHARRVGAANAE
jgi:uronate dehydrogenase